MFASQVRRRTRCRIRTAVPCLLLLLAPCVPDAASAITLLPGDLVVTAGQQDSRMLVREPLLSYDLVAMAKPLTKWAVQIQHPEEIPVILPRAFKVSQDPPRGPVFLALPSDVLDAEADLSLPKASAVYR